MPQPRRLRRARLLLLLTVVFVSACTPHRPQTYRLVPSQSRERLLVPPGLATPTVAQSLISVKAPKGRAPCLPQAAAIASRKHRGQIRITVTRDTLLKEPPGWLMHWTAELEDQGCITPGAAPDFANRILESLPLDPSAAYRLLHAATGRPTYVELGPHNRLQTKAPIMLNDAAPGGSVEISATSETATGSLNVDLVGDEEQPIGVETSWWALQPKPNGPGSTIVSLSAERNIAGRSAAFPAPLKNYFQFSPGINFYRLVYKGQVEDKGGIAHVIVGAPNRLELERRTQLVLDDFKTCTVSDPNLCAILPRHVGLNPFLAVTVNAVEVRLPLSPTVRTAIRAAGGPSNVDEVLPTLTVLKPYNNKLVPVEFDRTRPEILDLTLLGGESISWK
jgi:hypothetical protein